MLHTCSLPPSPAANKNCGSREQIHPHMAISIESRIHIYTASIGQGALFAGSDLRTSRSVERATRQKRPPGRRDHTARHIDHRGYLPCPDILWTDDQNTPFLLAPRLQIVFERAAYGFVRDRLDELNSTS